MSRRPWRAVRRQSPGLSVDARHIRSQSQTQLRISRHERFLEGDILGNPMLG
jgi:hypothetical protein